MADRSSLPSFDASDAGLHFEREFHDARPPHLVQFDWERTLMTPLAFSGGGSIWSVHGDAWVNGTRFRVDLRLEAALPRTNAYWIRFGVQEDDLTWPDRAAEIQSANAWLRMWVADLEEATARNPGDLARYAELRQAGLNATAALNSVAAVQQAIVGGMKQGGTFGTAHKEGGSHIAWRSGRFVRSDYGEDPGQWKSADEAEFFAMLRQLLNFEATRTAGPNGRSELEAWTLILRRMDFPQDDRIPPVVHHGASRPKSFYRQLGGCRACFAMIVLGLTIVFGAGLFFAKEALSIKSTGIPLGPSFRTTDHVLQLISTTEPYIVSLHRNPENDRFRIDLLAISVDPPHATKTFNLLRQQGQNALQPMTKILGVDDGVVWLQALGVFAVDLENGRVFGDEDLERQNPQLRLFLPSAHAEFRDRFIAVSPDWQKAYAFSPRTLKAEDCLPPKRDGWVREQARTRLESGLAAGGVLGSGRWIAALTSEEASMDYRVGSSMPASFEVSDSESARGLYGGSAEIEKSRVRFRSQQRLSAEPVFAGRFLRATPQGGLLTTADRDGVFVLFRPGGKRVDPLALRCVGLDGKTRWTCELGIGRLGQVLPGKDRIGLIGERPAVPNKVSEPILVFVDAKSGARSEVSLWR